MKEESKEEVITHDNFVKALACIDSRYREGNTAWESMVDSKYKALREMFADDPEELEWLSSLTIFELLLLWEHMQSDDEDDVSEVEHDWLTEGF